MPKSIVGGTMRTFYGFPGNLELREDNTNVDSPDSIELREDGTLELRE
jgi:hypothetical protein